MVGEAILAEMAAATTNSAMVLIMTVRLVMTHTYPVVNICMCR